MPDYGLCSPCFRKASPGGLKQTKCLQLLGQRVAIQWASFAISFSKDVLTNCSLLKKGLQHQG